MTQICSYQSGPQCSILKLLELHFYTRGVFFFWNARFEWNASDLVLLGLIYIRANAKATCLEWIHSFPAEIKENSRFRFRIRANINEP